MRTPIGGVREEGSTIHIDPKRVAVVGASGGAYLALMAGARVKPSLKAVISFYGYGDIAGAWLDPYGIRLSHAASGHEGSCIRGGRYAEVLSESPPTTRNAFYVYCRQNGLWPRR